MQSKCQLFPIGESDFFRNRLTHSLEVAQIGKGISFLLNTKPEFQNENAINPLIVEISGLAHDLGHPPFGHQGEKALDDCMAKNYGGFEGNAQTLRILTKIEKKIKDENSDELGMSRNGKDFRYGLNLTYRVLASILKYDHMITNRTKIQLTEEIFFDEYKKTLRRLFPKKPLNNIERLKNNLFKIIIFKDFKELLKKNGIVNEEGYPAESDAFYDNIEDLKLNWKLKEYEENIKKTLISWFNLVRLQKGYYKTERNIVDKIKKNVVRTGEYDNFRTIECQIMDIADDIAFSTYDLEDALKGNFISIFDCLKPDFEILRYITKKLNDCDYLEKEDYTNKDVINIFIRIFDEYLKFSKFEETYTMGPNDEIGQKVIYCFKQGSKY